MIVVEVGWASFGVLSSVLSLDAAGRSLQERLTCDVEIKTRRNFRDHDQLEFWREVKDGEEKQSYSCPRPDLCTPRAAAHEMGCFLPSHLAVGIGPWI